MVDFPKTGHNRVYYFVATLHFYSYIVYVLKLVTTNILPPVATARL